jgi:hypothetical protein
LKSYDTLIKMRRVRRYCLWIGLLVLGLFAAVAGADTFKLNTGEPITGEILPTTANDQGVQIKVGEGDYQRIPWASFSQEDLKKLQQIPRLEQYVEPFIEITTEEKLKKTEVNIKLPPRLERPANQGLLGAMTSSGLGILVLLLLYAANIYAGYEIAFFRGRPPGMVCGVSAALPVLGPILFLSLPPPPGRRSERPAEQPAAAPEAATPGTAAPVQTGTPAPAGGSLPRSEESINPMQGEAEHPGGLRLAHSETQTKAKPALPQTVTFQRGQFTFNRRFFETKFPGFFGMVKREADKDMVLVIKALRGSYRGQRISRIAANDLHLQIQHGEASEEVMVPFQEIQEIRLQHKDAL